MSAFMTALMEMVAVTSVMVAGSAVKNASTVIVAVTMVTVPSQR